MKVLDLDHYLEFLLRKPGALPGATAPAQARAAGVFTPTHDGISAALWVGWVGADVVAVAARRAAQQRGRGPPPLEATPQPLDGLFGNITDLPITGHLH